MIQSRSSSVGRGYLVDVSIEDVAKKAAEYLQMHSDIDGITFYFCGELLKAYSHNTIQDIVKQYNKILKED